MFKLVSKFKPTGDQPNAIKELVTFGCDISKYVPKEIVARVYEKYKN